MKYLFLCFTLALLCTSCTTYDDPITTKQNSKKKAFQTKSLLEHDLIGHVQECSTQVFRYSHAVDKPKKIEGTISVSSLSGKDGKKSLVSSESIQFSPKGRLQFSGSYSGSPIDPEDWFESVVEEKEQPKEKRLSKKLDKNGNFIEEKYNTKLVTYKYDSLQNCVERHTEFLTSSYKKYSKQTFTYDSSGNWVERNTRTKFDHPNINTSYIDERIVRIISYWPPEAIPKENKVLTYLSRSNLIVLLFSFL